jgi:hypothetical protein
VLLPFCSPSHGKCSGLINLNKKRKNRRISLRQLLQSFGKHSSFAPSDKTVVERLVRLHTPLVRPASEPVAEYVHYPTDPRSSPVDSHRFRKISAYFFKYSFSYQFYLLPSEFLLFFLFVSPLSMSLGP